ncbi:transcriptional regulator [Streptomyces krungchingensis]|uniref:transcriptional regulator n=1 Tax=Streptomyces TaxID=1883 RepID=UPI003CEE68E2
MTTVRTPPPPRLPVRDRAAAIGGNGGVSPMLSRLADERATGVLIRERGTLYLADGQVVHAESPSTPGLDVLLTARGVLDAEAWREAVAAAGARRRVGRFLVDHGRIAEGALELCHLGALYDAAYFVLGPSSSPTRFRYGAAHWLGPVHPVPVAALERETVRRRELLHRIWPDPATDTAPLLRSGLPAGPSVPLRQEAVLGRVDGVRTAADVSAALGRPAFHTLVDLRRLAAAGLVGAVPAPQPSPLPGVLTQPSADPDVALLRRLRDALEAL